jgi:hypothetical protein
MSALHPELALAKRNIALAEDKLRALQQEALRLSVFVIPRTDRVDALMDAARANGLFNQFRCGDIEHVIGQGLRGVATLAWNSKGASNIPRGDEKEQGCVSRWNRPQNSSHNGKPGIREQSAQRHCRR